METPMKVTPEELGSDSQPISGRSVDKSASIKDLAKRVGSSENPLCADKVAVGFPATPSTSSQPAGRRYPVVIIRADAAEGLAWFATTPEDPSRRQPIGAPLGEVAMGPAAAEHPAHDLGLDELV